MTYELLLKPRPAKDPTSGSVQMTFPEPELVEAEFVDLENPAFVQFWNPDGPVRIVAADHILSVKLVGQAKFMVN